MDPTYNSPLFTHIHDLPPLDVKAFNKLRQRVDESMRRIANIPPEKRLPREVVPCPAVTRTPLRQVTFTSGGVSGVCLSECVDVEAVVDDAEDLLNFPNNVLKCAVQVCAPKIQCIDTILLMATTRQWPGYAAKRFTLPLPRGITRGRLCQKLCVTIDNFYFTEIFSVCDSISYLCMRKERRLNPFTGIFRILFLRRYRHYRIGASKARQAWLGRRSGSWLWSVPKRTASGTSSLSTTDRLATY